MNVLAAQVQALAAGHEHSQVGAARKQRADLRRGILDVLEVVEHQQHLAREKMVRDQVGERRVRLFPEPER